MDFKPSVQMGHLYFLGKLLLQLLHHDDIINDTIMAVNSDNCLVCLCSRNRHQCNVAVWIDKQAAIFYDALVDYNDTSNSGKSISFSTS